MAEKAGFLTKEGGSIKTWKKRWCVLKNGALHYSKSQNSGALGLIELPQSKKIEVANNYKSKKHCFFIETPQRTYYICATSDSDRDSWVKELCAERDRVQGKSTPKAVPTSNGPSATPAAAASSAPAAASSSAAPAAPKSANEPQKVGLEDFVLLKVIGKGSFGKVISVRKKDTGKIYAMKILNKQAILARNELEHTKAEKNILQKLCHPFLVNLNYSFQTEDKLYFIMDFVNGGELFFHLQKDKKFTDERVRFYCAEIVLGLEYLHNTGVLYRDLKPENILLTDDGHICMTDFGISKEGLLKDSDRTGTFCGTPEYLAPEVLEGNGYGKAVDWWSFGTLMYEMLTGLPPFYSSDVQQMYSKIMTAKLNIPKSINEDAKDLLEKLLQRDPEKRLTDTKVIKAHPFFKGINWDALLAKEVTPPFIPPVTSPEDYGQIDPTFTDENPALSLSEKSEISDNLQKNFEGFTYVADSNLK